MRLSLALLALAPALSCAKCPEQPCFAVTFEVRACRAVAGVNEPYPGAYLTVESVRTREVACSPDSPLLLGSKPVPPEIAAANTYFYPNLAMAPCNAFSKKPVTLFVAAKCCDTIPPEPQCGVEVPIVRNLPPWAQ